MAKYFVAPSNKDDSGPALFSVVSSSGKIVVEELRPLDKEETEENSEKTIAFYHLDSESISYRNHNFPFNSRKRIEKVINFELEPYFPIKKDSYSLIFSQLKGENNKDLSGAFCIGSPDSLLDEKENELNAFNIEAGGFFPSAFSKVNSVLRLSFIKEESIIITREINGLITIFAVSGERVISAKKFNDTGNIKDLVSSVRLLNNYVKIALKNYFRPRSIQVLDSFGGKDIYQELRSHSSDNIKLITGERIKSVLPFESDLDISYILFANEVLSANKMVYRKKSPGFKKFFDSYKKEIIISSIFFILASSTLGYQIFNRFSSLKNQYEYSRLEVKKALKENFPQIKRITASPVDQAKIEIIKARKKKKNSDNNPFKIKKLKLLKSIIDSVPPESFELEKITILPVLTSITGTTNGYNLIDEVKNSLLKNEIVKGVEIAMATTDNSGKIRFRLEIKLNE